MGVMPSIQDESTMGCIELPRSSRTSNRTCLFFVAKHLSKHWVDEARVARMIVANMRPDWKVSVYLNKKTRHVAVGENEIAVVVCDNAHGPKKVMTDGEFYASVCFDESGEYSSTALHQLYGGIECGRFMLVSADVSSWFRLKPRKNTILHNLFPCWDTAFSLPCYDEASAITTAACLSMAAVFKASDREMVLRGSGSALEEIDLYTSTIKYIPSLLERLGHGSAVDLGDISGVQVFESKYGISITECETLGDIVKVMEDRIKELKIKNASTYSFQSVLGRIKQISTEVCPICLDTMEEARVLQPCLHFTCSGCVNKIGRKCPMCRCNLIGSIGVEASLSLKRPAENSGGGVSKKPSASDGSSSMVSSSRDLGDHFFDEVGSEISTYPVAGGVTPALNSVLEAIKKSNLKSRGGGTLRVMLICPGVCVRDDAISSMGFIFCPYRTVGTRADPARMTAMNATLEKFAEDDGEMKILSVRDKGQYCMGDVDNMTGLRLDKIDAVVTVGRGSTAQRLGRLCRLSRSKLPVSRRSALYVELVADGGVGV